MARLGAVVGRHEGGHGGWREHGVGRGLVAPVLFAQQALSRQSLCVLVVLVLVGQLLPHQLLGLLAAAQAAPAASPGGLRAGAGLSAGRRGGGGVAGPCGRLVGQVGVGRVGRMGGRYMGARRNGENKGGGGGGGGSLRAVRWGLRLRLRLGGRSCACGWGG